MRLRPSHTFDCAEQHPHTFGKCCSAECWCMQPPTYVKALGEHEMDHEPNALCAVAGWHAKGECRALTYPDGTGRPRNLVFYDGKGRWPEGYDSPTGTPT